MNGVAIAAIVKGAACVGSPLEPRLRDRLDRFFGPLGFRDKIWLSSAGFTRSLTRMLVRVFLTTDAVWLGSLSRRDLDTGLDESSWPVMASSLLCSSPVFLCRLRRAMMLSSPSIEDVLRFLSTRGPSIGSSSRASWLKTECESGFVAPFWEGSKSRTSLGAVDRRLPGDAVSSIASSTPASSSNSGAASESESSAHLAHLQLSGPKSG